MGVYSSGASVLKDMTPTGGGEESLVVNHGGKRHLKVQGDLFYLVISKEMQR